MSMSAKFKGLIRDLDHETFQDLHQFIAVEAEQRRSETAFQVENIHPSMTPEQRDQAASEITRALNQRPA
jgi:hypothetical protein